MLLRMDTEFMTIYETGETLIIDSDTGRAIQSIPIEPDAGQPFCPLLRNYDPPRVFLLPHVHRWFVDNKIKYEICCQGASQYFVVNILETSWDGCDPVS